MTARREFMKTAALAVAGASIGVVRVGAEPPGLDLFVSTQGGFARGLVTENGRTSAYAGVLGRGPWHCQHPLHAMLLLDDNGSKLTVPAGSLAQYRLNDGTTGWDLTGAAVEIVNGPVAGPIKPAPANNPSSFPTTVTQWNDSAWMPTLTALMPQGARIDPKWHDKLGSWLKIDSGEISLLQPKNVSALNGPWDFINGQGTTLPWGKAITDTVTYKVPLTGTACQLVANFGYKKVTIDVDKASAGAQHLNLRIVAGDVTTKYTYTPGARLQHFELFYAFLENEASHGCAQRMVPIYRGKRHPGEPTPGDFCPSPWIP